MGRGHRHVHRRQHHHHRQDDNPLGFVTSLEAQAASLLGLPIGPPRETPTLVNPPDVPQPAQPTDGAASPTGDNPGDNNNNNGQTTIYVTASRTFTGAFSLSTIQPQVTASQRNPDPQPSQDQDPTTTSSRKSSRRTRPTSVTDSAAAASGSAGATAAAASTTLATLASVLDSSSRTDSSSPFATTSGVSSASSDSSGSVGLSGGAKAGIAIGVILGILALAAGAFALWRMRKNRQEESYEINNSSEKNPFSDNASAAPPPPIAASMTNYPKPAYTAPQSAPPSNPFGSGAVPVASQAVSTGPASNMSGSTAMVAAAGAGAGMAAASVVGAEAANARRNSVPPPLNLNRAQSPALVPPPVIASSPHGSNFSESSTLTTGAMAAVGGAGAGAPGGPRMHRVQMDFNPTMEDELQISAGEIVRIVREFDDGWCSVEIMQRDAKGTVIRNQAGVVPRTCLSRLPLKPRQKRPVPPPSGPQSNAPSGRVQSPALIPNNGQRSMSPGPYGGGPQDRPQRPSENRSRSNSANDVSNRLRGGPIGPSPMNPASQAPSIQGNQNTEPFIAPLAPDHTRNGSVSSAAPSFARKPVPGKTDA